MFDIVVSRLHIISLLNLALYEVRCHDVDTSRGSSGILRKQAAHRRLVIMLNSVA